MTKTKAEAVISVNFLPEFKDEHVEAQRNAEKLPPASGKKQWGVWSWYADYQRFPGGKHAVERIDTDQWLNQHGGFKQFLYSIIQRTGINYQRERQKDSGEKVYQISAQCASFKLIG